MKSHRVTCFTAILLFSLFCNALLAARRILTRWAETLANDLIEAEGLTFGRQTAE